jgi:cytoskeletal protein RodZ
MKSPGELLKNARLTKGYSLAEAAAMTRISRTMLRHLEHDRFEEFNAEVFVRGHLRNYAREVGADPEKVVHAYERLTSARTGSSSRMKQADAAPRAAKRSAARHTSTKPRARKKPARSSSSPPRASIARWSERIGPTHMVAVVLVLVGFVLFVSLLSGNRATAQDPAKFPTKSQDAWELERDVEQTRWLLEQPASQDSDQK